MNHIIYHGNCFDGMAAAWVAARTFLKNGENFQSYPLLHGAPFPNFHRLMSETMEDTLYILDFSFDEETTRALIEQFKRVVILDHHKTAESVLSKFPANALFKLEESGASLAWDWFNTGIARPALVRYVKDRDLWLFQEYESRNINAFIQSYPMDIGTYEMVHRYLEENFTSCLDQGRAIERYKMTMVEKMAVENTRILDVGGYKVPVCNATILYSEIGHHLCELHPDSPFAAYYADRSDGIRQWGLRSIGDFDVSGVAKMHGGGGHKNAAGFQSEIPQAEVL